MYKLGHFSPIRTFRSFCMVGVAGYVLAGQVARRTVAKYREAMHIQPANLRKSI